MVMTPFDMCYNWPFAWNLFYIILQGFKFYLGFQLIDVKDSIFIPFFYAGKLSLVNIISLKYHFFSKWIETPPFQNELKHHFSKRIETPLFEMDWNTTFGMNWNVTSWNWHIYKTHNVYKPFLFPTYFSLLDISIETVYLWKIVYFIKI